MSFKKISKAIILYAGNFPDEVEQYCIDMEIDTHYQNDGYGFEWDNDELGPIEKYVLEEFGPEAKEYEWALIIST